MPCRTSVWVSGIGRRVSSLEAILALSCGGVTEWRPDDGEFIIRKSRVAKCVLAVALLDEPPALDGRRNNDAHGRVF